MYKTEGGLSALYRGIIPTISGVAPYVSKHRSPSRMITHNGAHQVGLNFMTYEATRGYLTPKGHKDPTASRKLLAGAVSGAVAQTLTYPL
jgi:solute carrier family 25 phosphate transporter 23/24/25/41